MRSAILIICGLLMGFCAHAAESDTSNSITVKGAKTYTIAKVKKKKKKKMSEDDIDIEITNARLRASTGSKSKWSMSLGLGYAGGSLKKPIAKKRPNIYGNPETLALTRFSTSIKGRYRVNKNVSATLGTSITMYTPFHGSPEGTNQFSIGSPSFGLSAVYKMGDWQSVTGASLSIGLSTNAKRVGSFGSFGVSQSILTSVKKLTYGAYFGIYFSNFAGLPTDCRFAGRNKKPEESCREDRGGPPGNTADVWGESRGGLTNWGYYAIPFVEYSLSDKVSLRTVFNWFGWDNFIEHDSPFDFERSVISQSVGVGFSISRNFYLYPNIQFLPRDFDTEKTNVGISATINLF